TSTASTAPAQARERVDRFITLISCGPNQFWLFERRGAGADPVAGLYAGFVCRMGLSVGLNVTVSPLRTQALYARSRQSPPARRTAPSPPPFPGAAGAGSGSTPPPLPI